MARKTRRSAKSEASRLTDRVRQAVDDGAKTAEEIHKAIADLPLDVLQRLDLFKQTARDVKKVQDSSIGAVYDLVRRVNREATQLAAELLERPPRARARRKKATRKASRASAAA